MEVKVQGNAWLPGKAAPGGGRLLAEAKTPSAGEQCDLLTSVFGACEEELLMIESIFRICHEMLFALL